MSIMSFDEFKNRLDGGESYEQISASVNEAKTNAGSSGPSWISINSQPAAQQAGSVSPAAPTVPAGNNTIMSFNEFNDRMNAGESYEKILADVRGQQYQQTSSDIGLSGWLRRLDALDPYAGYATDEVSASNMYGSTQQIPSGFRTREEREAAQRANIEAYQAMLDAQEGARQAEYAQGYQNYSDMMQRFQDPDQMFDWYARQIELANSQGDDERATTLEQQLGQYRQYYSDDQSAEQRMGWIADWTSMYDGGGEAAYQAAAKLVSDASEAYEAGRSPRVMTREEARQMVAEQRREYLLNGGLEQSVIDRYKARYPGREPSVEEVVDWYMRTHEVTDSIENEAAHVDLEEAGAERYGMGPAANDEEQQRLAQELARAQYIMSYAAAHRYDDLTSAPDFVTRADAGREAFERDRQQRTVEGTYIATDEDRQAYDEAEARFRQEAEDAGLTGTDFDWYVDTSLDEWLANYRTTSVNASIWDPRYNTQFQEPDERWTDEERQIFYCLYNDDPQKAIEYGTAVNAQHNAADAEERDLRTAEYATRNVGTGILSTAGSVLGHLAGGVWDYLRMMSENSYRGNIYDSQYLGISRWADMSTAAIAQKLNSYGTIDSDVPLLGGKGWGDVYQLFTSIAESATAIAIGGSGAVVNLVFGGNAAATTTREALDRGLDAKHAVLTGFAAGCAEAIFEEFSIENLLSTEGLADYFKAGVLRTLGKQGGIELSEEMATSIANEMMDRWINQGESEYAQRIFALELQGMTYDDAVRQAGREVLRDVCIDGIGGFLSGGIMAGGRFAAFAAGASLSTYDGSKGSAADLIDLAHMAPAGTQANRFASTAQAQMDRDTKRSPSGHISTYTAAKLLSYLDGFDVQTGLQTLIDRARSLSAQQTAENNGAQVTEAAVGKPGVTAEESAQGVQAVTDAETSSMGLTMPQAAQEAAQEQETPQAALRAQEVTDSGTGARQTAQEQEQEQGVTPALQRSVEVTDSGTGGTTNRAQTIEEQARDYAQRMQEAAPGVTKPGVQAEAEAPTPSLAGQQEAQADTGTGTAARTAAEEQTVTEDGDTPQELVGKVEAMTDSGTGTAAAQERDNEERGEARRALETIRSLLEWVRGKAEAVPAGIREMTRQEAEDAVIELAQDLGLQTNETSGFSSRTPGAQTESREQLLQRAMNRVTEYVEAAGRIVGRGEERVKKYVADLRDARKQSGEAFKGGIESITLDDGTTANITEATYNAQTKEVTFKAETSDGRTVDVARDKLDTVGREVFDFLVDMSGEQQAAAAFNVMQTDQNVYDFGVDFRVMTELGQRMGADRMESAVEEYRGSLTKEQARTAFMLGQGMTNRNGPPVRRFSVKGSGKVSFDGGTVDGVHYNAVSDKTLADIEAGEQIDYIRALAKALEINVVFFESTGEEVRGADGKTREKLTGAQGIYQDGTIFLDVNAGMNYRDETGRRMMVLTMAHELTHFIRQNAEERYEELRQAVTDWLLRSQSVNFNELVRSKIDRSSGGRMSYDAAVEEVIADACEDMLQNSEAVRTLANRHKGLFGTIRNYLNRFLNRVLARHAEAKALMPVMKEMQELWDRALMDAVENRLPEDTLRDLNGNSGDEYAAELNRQLQEARRREAAERQRNGDEAERLAELRRYTEAVKNNPVRLDRLALPAHVETRTETQEQTQAAAAQAVQTEAPQMQKPKKSNGKLWRRFNAAVESLMDISAWDGEELSREEAERIVMDYALTHDGYFDEVDEAKERGTWMTKEQVKESWQSEKFGGPQEIENEDGDDVATVDSDIGSGMFSLRTFEEGGREALRSFLGEQIRSEALKPGEAEQIMKQIEQIYKVCQKYEGSGKYAPFSAWSNAEVVTYDGKPVFSVVKANGEYKLNLDFSLVCKKRRTLDAVFNEMISRGIMDDFDMVQESIAKINDIIRDNGFETACGLCFVDSKRYRQGMIAQEFAMMYNRQVLSLLKKGADQKIDFFNYGGDTTIRRVGGGIDTLSDDQLDWTVVNRTLATQGKQTVAWKIANLLKNDPSQRKLVRRGDFMSTAGFDAVKAKNPELLKLYNSKKGAGGPKAAQSDVQYLNEIISQNAFNEQAAYDVGGVRIQSFSDYVGRMVFDYVQMVGDLAAKKLPAHSYTKEFQYALQFGLTGIKINMSLVPEIIKNGVAPGLDANGDYAWKDGQSFGSTVYDNNGKRLTAAEGFDLAKQIQNADGYSRNCGTIAVGVSDEHIMKMLDDPDIRMIIPYHKSSLNHIVASMMNIDKYEDYTLQQSTRKRSGSSWTKLPPSQEFNFNEALQRTGDAKAAAAEYLAWCKKNGYLPKFDHTKGGHNFSEHENYYKLLEDFSCYDRDGVTNAPMGAVTMTFPTENDAFGSMADLIADGLEEDAILQAKQDAAVPDIVAQIQAILPEFEGTVRERNAKKGKKKAAQKSGARMSLRELSDGRRYVDLDIGQDQFDGLTIDEQTRLARKIIIDKFAHKVIGHNNTVFVNRVGANEYAYPAKYIKDPDIRSAKMRASAELDNLIEAGTNFRSSPDGRDGHIHPKAIGGFSYFDTLFKIGNEWYSGVINILNNSKGRLFKDVTKIENVTKDIMASYGQDPVNQFLSDISMPNVPYMSMKVKSKSADAKKSDRENLGYHAGDLGKAEHLNIQGYYRGTGHFGTGTYFVGEEEKVTKDSHYGKRPQHAVDFTDYNLFKVRNDRDGYRLHDFLRIIDGGIKREWIQPALENEFSIISPTGYYDLAHSKYGEDWALGDNLLNAMLEYAANNGISIETLDEYKAGEGNGIDESDLMDYYTDYVKDAIKEGIDNVNAEYRKFSDALFNVHFLSGFTPSKIFSALTAVADYQDVTPRNAKVDSYATVFMKAMGYEGVDTRGTRLDNTEYGSVIYDVKPETVKYSERDNARTDRELLMETDAEELTDAERTALDAYRKKVESFADLEQQVQAQQAVLDDLVRQHADGDQIEKARTKLSNLQARMQKALNTVTEAEKSDKTMLEIIRKEREIQRRRTRMATTEAFTKRELRARITKLYNDLNRRITNPSEKKNIPAPLLMQAIDVLEAINMDSSRPGSKAGQKLRNKLMELRQKYAALRNDPDFRNAAVYDDVVAELLDSMIEKVGDTTINKMSAAQMLAVYEALTALDKTARTALKIRMLGEERDAYEVAMSMQQETAGVRKPSKNLFAQWLNAQLSPERMFNRMGGHVLHSAWNDMYRMLNDGQLRATQVQMDGTLIFDELLQSKEYEGFVDPKKTVDIGLRDENGKVIPVTHGMMVSLYMHLLNKQNAKHVARGGLTVPDLRDYYNGKRNRGIDNSVRAVGVSQEIAQRREEILEELRHTSDQLEADNLKEELSLLGKEADLKASEYLDALKSAIEEKMTDYDRRWVAAAQELFDDFSKARLNETTMDVYGIKRANVEHYMPIWVDGDFLATPFESVAKDMSLENAGYMKERIDSGKPMRLADISDVASTQLRRVSQYVGLMPVVRNFGKVWGKVQTGYRSSLQNTVRDRFGQAGINYVENLIADLNGARRSPDGPLGEFFNAVRGHMARASLTLSLRTAMGQAASYPTAASVVGWDALRKALFRGGRSGRMISRADQELIRKYSPLLWYRMKGYSTTELGDIASSNSKFDRTWRKMRWATGWIQAMDGATVGRLWYAAEYYVQDHEPSLKKGTDEYYRKVAEVFNDVVEKTQPNYTTMQRPDILRNPNALVRQLTMFLTQRLQNFNILYDSAATYTRAKADLKAGRNGVTQADVQEAGRSVRRAAVSQVVAAATIAAFKFLADAILHSMNAYRDDDKELTTESVSMELLDMFIDSLAGNVLGGSEVYDLIESRLFGKTYYGIEVSGLSTVTDVIESVNKTLDAALADGASLSTVWSRGGHKLAQNIGSLFGIPYSNAEKIVKGLYWHTQDLVNGEFLSYEAGVDRTTAQQAHRLYRAYTSSNFGTAKRIREEVGDDEKLDAALVSFIKKQFAEGEITQKQATDYLTRFAGKSAEAAEKTMREYSCEVESGTKYSQIRDALLTGQITEDEAADLWKKYGGMSAEDARIKAAWTLYENAHADTSFSSATFATYYKTVRSSGVSADVYEDIRTGADTDGNGSIKQQEAADALTEAIRAGTVTREQAEAIWKSINKSWKKSYSQFVGA